MNKEIILLKLATKLDCDGKVQNADIIERVAIKKLAQRPFWWKDDDYIEIPRTPFVIRENDGTTMSLRTPQLNKEGEFDLCPFCERDMINFDVIVTGEEEPRTVFGCPSCTEQEVKKQKILSQPQPEEKPGLLERLLGKGSRL